MICGHHTILGARDLGQNPEGFGLGGAGPRTPVLCVLSDALPAGVGMSGYVVKLDVCVHNVSPGNSGRTQEPFYRLLQTQQCIKHYGIIECMIRIRPCLMFLGLKSVKWTYVI